MSNEMETKKQRLDIRLVDLGLTESRNQAKDLIQNGKVTVNGAVQQKPSCMVTDSDNINCDTESRRFVGRGGYKLEKALEIYPVAVLGQVAMDVGASTGGFTDCLLQRGASLVYAVDVGHGQLRRHLSENEHVINLEGTDIRDTELMLKTVAPHSVDFCSIDVSFISLTKVLPAVTMFLKDNATVVCLIKPQFEAGREAIGKNGVVKSPAAHIRVLQNLCRTFPESQLTLRHLDYSPITGGEGNIEYLAVLRYADQTSPLCPDIKALVTAAMAALK